MPKARLVVNIVSTMMFKPASAANAEPTIIPSNIKVESNNVLMKNLRIIGPTLSCLIVLSKLFTNYTNSWKKNIDEVISTFLGFSPFYFLQIEDSASA